MLSVNFFYTKRNLYFAWDFGELTCSAERQHCTQLGSNARPLDSDSCSHRVFLITLRKYGHAIYRKKILVVKMKNFTGKKEDIRKYIIRKIGLPLQTPVLVNKSGV